MKEECTLHMSGSSKGIAEEIIRVKKGLNPLKIRCFISCQKTKGF